MNWFDVDFGNDKTGLTSVHYRFYDAVGSSVLARASTGVIELNGGAYGVNVSIPASAVGIEWDTGEPTATYAHESITMMSAVFEIQNKVKEIYQVLGLEAGSPMTQTVSTRAVASITQTFVGNPAFAVVVTRT